MSAKIILIILLSFILTSGCGHRARSTQANAPSEHLGTHYTTLEFDKGDASLSELSKLHLDSLAEKASKDGREIESIKILTWPDKEYPTEPNKTKAGPQEVSLARERSRAVTKYLEEDLHTEDNISAYNMAKRPNLASKLFKSDDWTVKEAFEKSGTTATKLSDGSLSYTKASKALVIIDYVNEKL